MTIPQPNSTNPLNSPDHSLQHRIISADPGAAVESLIINADNDTFNQVHYGSMYVYNLGAGFTVSIGLQDHFYILSNAQMTAGTSNGFTFQNSQELKADADGAGKYFAVWSISFESATSNQEAEGTIGVNGSALDPYASHATIANGSRPGVISGSGILTLNGGDLVQMYIQNHTGANDLIIDHLTLTLSRVGN